MGLSSTTNHQRWSLVAVTVLVLASIAAVFAVDQLDQFELEGNARNDGNKPYDAADIYDLVMANPADPNYPLLVAQFVTDPVESPDDDIAAGGGTKDVNDLDQWKWKLGEPNDKNDIGNVFLALFELYDPQHDEDDSVLYFGLDVLSQNGDAALGFWFLQNDVSKLGNGSPPGSPFSDVHEEGDVFVQLDVTNGGNSAEVFVYTWDGSGLNLEFSDQRCVDDPNTAQVACADWYDGEGFIEAPWPYQFKGQEGIGDSDFPAFAYFEAGLNLSDIFPEGLPCLRSFVAETRQSQSETAALEDFVLGQFDLCGFSVDKTAESSSKLGDTINYTVTIENTGAIDLTKVSIIDDPWGDLTDADNVAVGDVFVSSNDCGATLSPNASCTIEYQYTVAGDPNDPLDNEVTAIYSAGGTNIEESDSHGVELFQPAISLDKKVKVPGGAEFVDGPVTVLQGQSVDYQITLTNDSSDDTPLLKCTITDAQLGVDDPNIPLAGVPYVLTNGLNSGELTDPNTPFVNVASATCTPVGFANVFDANDPVTVNVDPAEVYLTVMKTGDAFTKAGDDVSYEIKIKNLATTDYPIYLTSIQDSLIGDFLDPNNPNLANVLNSCPSDPNNPNDYLAPDSMCSIVYDRTTDPNDPDPLVNSVAVAGVDRFGNANNAQHSVQTDVLHPGISVDKSCLPPTPLNPGVGINFQIRIKNTGDVNLTTDIDDALLGIDIDNLLLGVRSPDPNSPCADVDWGNGATDQDDAADGCFQIEDGIVYDPNQHGDPVYNQVFAYGLLPENTGLANNIDGNDDASCDVPDDDEDGDATRTLGFWKSHGSDDGPMYGYTCHVFTDHLGGQLPLAWNAGEANDPIADSRIQSCADIFGVYWSSMARESDDKKRNNKVCKAKLQASWQYLAAYLNSGLDNGAPVPDDSQQPGTSLLDAMYQALQGNDFRLIKRLAGELDAYNQSGDEETILDNDGTLIPHADPTGARLEANYEAGDC